jgi:thiol-disulfide isomerase/thioredoxin
MRIREEAGMDTVEAGKSADAPTQAPRPKFFDQRFWTGFGSGVAAGIFGIILALALLMIVVTHEIRSTLQDAGGIAAVPKLSAPPLPGLEQADYGLSLASVDGAAFDAASLRGRVVFLNFWATWCGPCRAEMPAIQRLYDRTRAHGVVFAAVSDEKSETIARFLKSTRYSFPCYRLTGKRPAVYQTSAIPATFILSSDGRIAFKHIGAARWDDERALAFLKSLPAAAPH